MAPPLASGTDDDSSSSSSSSSSPFSFKEGNGVFFSRDFCWAFRRRARRDCERERLPGGSETSESVVSLVWGLLIGGSLEDIVVMGRWLGRVAEIIRCSWG